MRSTSLSAILMLSLATVAGAATRPGEAGEPWASLEDRWKQCVHDAYADQPSRQSRAASQVSALDACKEYEDAYVAAVMAARAADEQAAMHEGPGLASKAKAWAASVLAYVMEPVSAWRDTLARR